MATNRETARQQATERLSTKRDALREEQARVKLMMEAARPSMPELKATARAPTATDLPLPLAPPTETSGRTTKEGIDSNVPSSTPQDTDKVAKVSASNSMRFDEQVSPVGMPPPRVTGIPPGRKAGHGTGIGKGVLTVHEPDERRPGSRSPPRPARGGATRPPPVPAAAGSFPQPSASLLPRPSTNDDKERREDGRVGESSAVSSDENGGGGSSIGQPHKSKDPFKPEQAGEGSSSSSSSSSAIKNVGVKRRGTPIRGAEMQPPPPAKRPQQRESLSTTEGAANREQPFVPISTSTKRAVKGPAAMPPPLGKTLPAIRVENAAGASKGCGEKLAGKGDVLEGGDADWVPPKGQAGDGRTALNAKFGY